MSEPATVRREEFALAASGIPRVDGSAAAVAVPPAWVRAFSVLRRAVTAELRRFPLPGLEPDSEEELWRGEPEWPRDRAAQFASAALEDEPEADGAPTEKRIRAAAEMHVEPEPAVRQRGREIQSSPAPNPALGVHAGRAGNPGTTPPVSNARPQQATPPERSGVMSAQPQRDETPAPNTHAPAVIARAAGPSLSVRVMLHETRGGITHASNAAPEIRTRETILEIAPPLAPPRPASPPGTATAKVQTIHAYPEPVIEPMTGTLPRSAVAPQTTGRQPSVEPEWAPPPRPRADRAMAGRKVHIENLHITVQRPAVTGDTAAPAAQSAASPNSAPPFPEPFAKRGFNPWLRRDVYYE